jgi:hypothetical protein
MHDQQNIKCLLQYKAGGEGTRDFSHFLAYICIRTGLSFVGIFKGNIIQTVRKIKVSRVPCQENGGHIAFH